MNIRVSSTGIIEGGHSGFAATYNSCVYIANLHNITQSFVAQSIPAVVVPFQISNRVRTIPALRYWELGDICVYWVVSLSGDTFFGCDTQCHTFSNDRSANGAVRVMAV